MKSPKEAADRALSATLIATSDITLLLDGAGTVRSVTLGQLEQPLDGAMDWVGRDWIDTVTAESRPRIAEMLAEVASSGMSRRREVTQVTAGTEVPVAFAVARMDAAAGQLVAVGRDLRAIAAMQQRLVEAQQLVERDYQQMRQVDARYRLLLQLSSEPVLMVDPGTLKILEANPAAIALFDQSTRRLAGRTFPIDVDEANEQAVAEQVAALRTHGRVDDVVVRLATSGRTVRLSASLMRQDGLNICMVRALPEPADATGGVGNVAVRLVEALPDGFVVTDEEGRVVLANRAFLEMVELPTIDQVRGQPLGAWLGRPGADVAHLFELLRERKSVRLFGTVVRGSLGGSTEVEVSSVEVFEEAGSRAGLLVRDVSRRLSAGPRGAGDLTQVVEQMTALVGQVPLQKLVGDTTGLLELHFIKAALEVTSGNRTSAAELLGVSRQSLHLKLKRYGLGGDPGATTADGVDITVRRKSRKRGG